MEYNPVVFEKLDEINAAYDSGRCDAYTTDPSGLYAIAPDADHAGRPHHPAGDHLQGAAGPAVRQGDDKWFDIVKWTLFALLDAEELGVTQANVDEMKNTTIRTSGACWAPKAPSAQMIGLENDWAATSSRPSATTARSSTATSAPDTPLRSRAASTRCGHQGRHPVRAADPLVALITSIRAGPTGPPISR